MMPAEIPPDLDPRPNRVSKPVRPGSDKFGAVVGIAQLQAITGVTLRAIRYYEAAGLISARRTANGARVFTPTQVDAAITIVRLRRAGVPVAAIKGMLDPGCHPADRFSLIRIALEARAADLQNRLDGIRSALAEEYCT
ncbi:hypothetical protein BH10PSE1_BH10PSE1_14760 [soil metagenome]